MIWLAKRTGYHAPENETGNARPALADKDFASIFTNKT